MESMIDFLGRYGVRLLKGLFNFITTNPIRADTVSLSPVSRLFWLKCALESKKIRRFSCGQRQTVLRACWQLNNIYSIFTCSKVCLHSNDWLSSNLCVNAYECARPGHHLNILSSFCLNVSIQYPATAEQRWWIISLSSVMTSITAHLWLISDKIDCVCHLPAWLNPTFPSPAIGQTSGSCRCQTELQDLYVLWDRVVENWPLLYWPIICGTFQYGGAEDDWNWTCQGNTFH